MAEPGSDDGPRVSGLERAIRQLLTVNATRSERLISTVRLVLCSLALIRALSIENGFARLLELDPKPWVATTSLTLGALASAALLLALRRREVRPAELWASACIDSAVVTATLLPGVLWPRADLPGLLQVPDHAFFLLITIASGLRLGHGLVWASGTWNASLLIGLVVLQERLFPDAERRLFNDLTMGLLILLGGTAIAAMITARTRALVLRGATEATERERVRQRLGAYLSEEIAETAMAGELELGGRRLEVAVLFSDLRGFTTYAEGKSPEALVAELNAYLEAVVRPIRDEGGVVDKYVGDAVMAVFGIPLNRPDDALRALRAAVGMQAALARHNEERAGRNLPALRQGIGVHVGTVVAGNVGTRERVQYTCLGDAVNVASRLEGATKVHGVSLIASDEVVRRALEAGGDVDALGLEVLGDIALRGREQTLQAWTRASTTPPYDA